MKLISVCAFSLSCFALGSEECPNDLSTCIDMCPADIFKFCLQSCQKRCAPNGTEDVSRNVIGGLQAQGGFTLLEPDPEHLIWEEDSRGFKNGWLKVPVRHDEHVVRYDEEIPFLCLRVSARPARTQPARLGPILLHCGGPGSGAECAYGFGEAFMELNSSALVGPPLSEDYDYWSISQRGVDQSTENSVCPFKDEHGSNVKIWPFVECEGRIQDLATRSGVEAVLELMDGNASVETWDSTIKPVLDGPTAEVFGTPFYNETWARWYYRTSKLQLHLCYHDEKYSIMSAAGRGYNLLNYIGTENLAYDIETFRMAIGAAKMSVFGTSYGTSVGSVYATVFPDKVHRLIIDGNIDPHPDVFSLVTSFGEGTEATWTGLSEACDASLMGGGPAEERCPAAPGATGKLYNILHATKTSTSQAQLNALYAFSAFNEGVYEPGVPSAYELMKCIDNLYLGKAFNESSCHEVIHRTPDSWSDFAASPDGPFSGILGNDNAGRFTEQTFIEWWRKETLERPLGLTNSLLLMMPALWPGLPFPQPPVGDTTVAPLIIGNLHDAQTPYHNAQRMKSAFPSGRLLTWQGYGHGLQMPWDVTATVKRFEEETQHGMLPTYSNDVAKLLCTRVALQYLKDGSLPRDYVCTAAAPAMTGPHDATGTTAFETMTFETTTPPSDVMV